MKAQLTFLLEDIRLPVSGYVYLGMALKNHAPVLFHSYGKINEQDILKLKQPQLIVNYHLSHRVYNLTPNRHCCVNYFFKIIHIY